MTKIALSWSSGERLTVPGTTADGAPAPYPVGPVEYLEQTGTTANVLVPFVAGAYVSWKLHPRVKVSIDSRYEAAYPPERLEEHVDFHSASPRWRAVLEAYPTDLVLVRSGSEIAARMATQTPWALVYQDDAYSLFSRPGLGLPVVDRRHQRLLGRFP